MIFMPFWLLKYAPQIIVSAGIGLLGVYGVHVFREQGRDELRPEVQRLQQELDAERADRQRADAAADSYRLELEALRSRVRTGGPVRLCRNPGAAEDTSKAPSGAAGATTPAGSGAGSAGASLEAGPDIGPELRDLADQCDAQNAKLRALQKWVLSSP